MARRIRRCRTVRGRKVCRKPVRGNSGDRRRRAIYIFTRVAQHGAIRVTEDGQQREVDSL